jgi:hypothetical protein
MQNVLAQENFKAHFEMIFWVQLHVNKPYANEYLAVFYYSFYYA